MSIVNDLKKLLFGAKAVTKSAAEKAGDAGREAGGNLVEKGAELVDSARHKMELAADSAGELLNKALDKTEALGEAAIDKASDIWEQLAQKTAPIDSTPQNPPAEETFAASSESTLADLLPPDPQPSKVEELGKTVLDTAEKVGSQVLEHGGEALDKVMGVAEQIGEKVLHASEGAGEKIMEAAEDIGGKILEKGGETFERAKSLGRQVFEKASDLMEKAQEEAAKENLDDTVRKAEALGDQAAQKASSTGFSEKPIDTKDSLFEKHESFFERAARFAEGDYHAKPGTPTIGKDPDYKPSKPEGSVTGFTDNDGDGNELIDDAILDDEEKG